MKTTPAAIDEKGRTLIAPFPFRLVCSFFLTDPEDDTGARCGDDVEIRDVEPFVILVSESGADQGPDGLSVALVAYRVDVVGRCVGFLTAFVVYVACHDLSPLFGLARTSTIETGGKDGKARRVRTRGPLGIRLDALLFRRTRSS